MPAGQWRGHYARCFATVELDNAFYRLPQAPTFDPWASAVPDDFVSAVEASRYLTHVRQLKEPQEPVKDLMERARGLGSKLGPVPVQLPPNLRVECEPLERTLAAFPRGVRVPVELRHESWFDPAVRSLLEPTGTACCMTDTDGGHGPLWRTTDWAYLRFHHGRGKPLSCYRRAALDSWARRVGELWPNSSDVFAYFNNEGYRCAPRDGRRFSLALRKHALSTTRFPAARDLPLSSG
jgi:uncharacterized protein YecE (DUF72 family)